MSEGFLDRLSRIRGTVPDWGLLRASKNQIRYRIEMFVYYTFSSNFKGFPSEKVTLQLLGLLNYFFKYVKVKPVSRIQSGQFIYIIDNCMFIQFSDTNSSRHTKNKIR